MKQFPFLLLNTFHPLRNSYLQWIKDPSRSVLCDHIVYNYIFRNLHKNYNLLWSCTNTDWRYFHINIYTPTSFFLWLCSIPWHVSKCTSSSTDGSWSCFMWIGWWLVDFCYCNIAVNIVIDLLVPSHTSDL